jgi:hypothetical protein
MCGCVQLPGVRVIGEADGSPERRVKVGTIGWQGLPAQSEATVTGSLVAHGLRFGLITEVSP